MVLAACPVWSSFSSKRPNSASTARDVPVIALEIPAQGGVDLLRVRPEFQRVRLVAFLLFGRRVQVIRMRRIPGDHQHPGLAAVALDEVDPLVGHQCGVVAMGLDLAAGSGIEGEGLIEVLVGVRPDMPIFIALARGAGGNESPALVAGREVPLPDIAGPVARAAKGLADGNFIGAQMQGVVDDASLVGPAAGLQHGAVGRAHRIVRNAIAERHALRGRNVPGWAWTPR